MPRHRRIATLLCLLGLWLQMMAPALAVSMQRHATTLTPVICHSGGGGEAQDHGRNPPPHAPSCDHCLLCHALAGGVPTDDRPAFTLFDYPVSSPVRWAVAVPFVRLAESGRNAQPRGPPPLD